MFVDTHAHLQWASFDRDRAVVIGRARKARLEYIVNIGFDLEGGRKAIELAKEHRGLYATVGIHPHNASQLDQNVLSKLREHSENPKAEATTENTKEIFQLP